MERKFDLACIVHKHYHEDTVFVKVLECPTAHLRFGIRDKLIWTKNQMGRDVVCILQKAFLRGRRLVKIIINQAQCWPTLQLATSGNFIPLSIYEGITGGLQWALISNGTAAHAVRVKSQRTLIRSPVDCYTPYRYLTAHGSR